MEGHAGRVLELCQQHQGAMVSTWQKPTASLRSGPAMMDTAAQTELWGEHAVSPVSGCGPCPALTPVWDNSHEYTCGRCTQVEGFLCLMAVLREDVSRLRSTRKSERETDYWNHTVPSLGQAQQADRTRDTKDSLSSLRLAERVDLRDGGNGHSSCPAQWARLLGDCPTFPGTLG